MFSNYYTWIITGTGLFWMTYKYGVQIYLYLNEPHSELEEFPHSKNLKTLQYTFRGQPYKIFVKIRRGPSSIVSVYTDQDSDVTDLIRQYIGPNDDFHGSSSVITPELLGFENLRFEMIDGSVKYFFGTEPIYRLI